MISQPYVYRRHELAEPDWRRFPGWAQVSAADWESAQWQRAHCIKNSRQLRQVMGEGLTEAFMADLERDQRERATMSMLIPPQMINTMVPTMAPDEPEFTEAFYADPVRRYMIPAFSDRRADWPSHPYAQRDSLHEAEMWAVEGLTHRYPTKVLAELLPTCPQYCGHCTRMDLVGNPTTVTDKHKFALAREDRLGAMLSLFAQHAGCARRGGVRRGRGEPAVATAGVVRGGAARDRLDQGHQAGKQGADGPAAALAVRRGAGGHVPAGRGRPRRAA